MAMHILLKYKISKKDYAGALDFAHKGYEFDNTSLWLMRLSIVLLRRISPADHSSIRKILEEYSLIRTEKYDLELSFELAKQTYMDGRIPEAKSMFGLLFRRSQHHPRRLIPREPEDRWFEKEGPKRFYGTITQIPTENRYGRIRTTNPPQFDDLIAVRFVDTRYLYPKVGDRVSYEIVFNMLGPEASKVRE